MNYNLELTNIELCVLQEATKYWIVTLEAQKEAMKQVTQDEIRTLLGSFPSEFGSTDSVDLSTDLALA